MTNPDMEWVFIDDSYAKVHQHMAEAVDDKDQAVGKSRVGNTSRNHLALDAYRFPIVFEIVGGQINDSMQALA